MRTSLVLKCCALIGAMALSACGTPTKVTEQMLQAHMAAQAQPTLRFTCPSGGCELSYTDPRDRHQFRAPTNGWDAITALGQSALGVAQASVVPLAMGAVAVKGFQALVDAKAPVTTTHTTGPVTNTTVGANSGANSGTTSTTAPVSTTTTTVGANSGANSGTTTTSTTAPVTTNTSTVGANSGANSGNSGRISGTSMADNTSTPTVVTQPAPVVVTQPAPVVVTQPPPVVVTPPSTPASGS